jgi:tetratricopeptide (TPR) repeat protein
MEDFERIERILEDAEALAESWRIEGRWADAITLLYSLRPVATQQGHATLARMWLLAARVLTDQAIFGGFDTLAEREEALNQALTHAELAGEPSLLGGVWDAQGFSLHAAYLDGDRRTEPEHEMEYFERGLVLRQQANQSPEVAESLFHIGLVYGVVRHDHAQALPHFEEAYRLAQDSGDQVIASYAIRHIAFAHYAAGDIARARVGLEESLHLREAARFEPGVAMALIALASAEAALGDKTQAVTKLERARDIFEWLGATRRLAQVDEEIAQLRQI